MHVSLEGCVHKKRRAVWNALMWGSVLCPHQMLCECAQELVVKGWHILAVPISGLLYKGSSGFSLVFVEHVNTVLL